MSGREKPLILQNGVPIPQAYDKDLGDWTEYSTEHIKAIKAELALVKAELQTIKANQLSGDQKVQLSGTNVPQETTILARAVRRANSGIILINPPAGLHVRGVAIVCRIYGVTGTFGETEGLDMETGTFAGAYPAYAGEFMGTGKRLKATGGVAHIWLPGGTTVGDSQPLTNYVYKRSGSPFVRGYLALNIDGTFTSEEGFDCEVKAIWQV